MRPLAFLLLLVAASSLGVVTRAQPAPKNLVTQGPWSGAITSGSAVVVAKLNVPRFATLEVSEERYFARILSIGAVPTPPGDLREITRFHVVNLKPNTKYYYRVRAGDVRDEINAGTFTTHPLVNRPASFTFAFGSCAETGSPHFAFAEIRALAPLFFLHTGDLHYENIITDDRALFRAAYDRVLGSKTQGELYRAVPIVSVWDDHDFGGNDSDRNTPARLAAHATYREYVPHYPLAADADPAFAPLRPDSDLTTEKPRQLARPISQAFTIGRVRFIVLDCRSERDPASAPDGPGKSMLGAWQKAWLKEQLISANQKHPLIFIVSSVSWISNDTATGDNWGRYAVERAELSDWMVENNIKGVCFLGGDAHMLAADDGSHNTYGERGGTKFPALQAAPLNRKGSLKGGPWSVTPVLPVEGEGQFGMVDIKDRDGQIEVLFRGLNQDSQEKLRFTFKVPTR